MTREEKVLVDVNKYIDSMRVSGKSPSKIVLYKKHYQVLVDADIARQKKAGIDKPVIRDIKHLFNIPIVVV